MRGYCILRTRGAMRAALVWVHPVKIDKPTVSSPPEARSSPPERFWGVEHGSALGRAPLLRTARARSRVGCQTRGVVVVGEKWAHVVRTPSDRKVVGAGPVDSGHGSYQLVSWWGGQCWWPPMAHAQWWQSGSAIRDVATTNASWQRSPFGQAHVRLRRRRDVVNRAAP